MSAGAERTRKEISVKQVEEIYAKNGHVTPTATTYFPEFNDHILTLGPEGTESVAVNELYCLTIPSAMELMVVLADLLPTGFMDDPQVFAAGSHFYYSEQVPWLKFANGAVRNAGQLAQYWKGNNGDPNGTIADRMAREDVAWG